MTQNFKQFRYFNNNSSYNYPTTLTSNELISGECFKDYLPITSLGISALPGTKFYINGSDTPVIVGFTGLFELDFSQGGTILSLQFDSRSIENIKANNSSYLLIDIVYLGGGN